MQEHLWLESFYLILATMKQNDGLVVFVNGSHILRTRLPHENKFLILLGRWCVYVYMKLPGMKLLI